MNIFCDFHHPALYYSLYLLFEKRLGYKIYRPIGKEWADSPYWKILDLCVNQYQINEKLSELLIKDSVPPTSTRSWNEVIEETDDFTLIKGYGGCPVSQRGISLEQFKRLKFDFGIATFINNVGPFEELFSRFQGHKRIITQLGNEWDLTTLKDKNVLASIKKRKTEIENIVFYHQEFDLDLFCRTKKFPQNRLVSFVCNDDIAPIDKSYMKEVNSLLKNYYSIFFYGKNSPDGFIEEQSSISSLMEEAKFGIHIKTVGDGFGHTIHNWAAKGRPIIYRGSYYKNTLAELLLKHQITGFNIDLMSPKELAYKIISMPDNEYQDMSSNIYNLFVSQVDFTRDAQNVKTLLEKI